MVLFMGRTTMLFSEKIKRPNIVILLTDDQGNADVGYQISPATSKYPCHR